MSSVNNNNSIYNSLLLDKNKPAGTTARTQSQEPAVTTKPTTNQPKDESRIDLKASNFDPVTKGVSFKAPPKGTQATPPASGGTRPKNLDDVSTFHKTDIATPADIDKILKRYNSPHAGKGQVIFDTCKKYGVNPIMMLAIMQQESQFGSTKLKPENTANPWSVHFNHGAKGIAKLRLPDGKLPTFEQSLEGGIKTVIKLAGNSSTPLTTAGAKYSESGNWTSLIKQHYNTLLKRY